MPESVFHGRPGEVRQIALALVVSLVIHALILALLPGLKDRAREPRTDPLPLVARLTEVRGVPSPPPSEAKMSRATQEKPRAPERIPVKNAQADRSAPVIRPQPERLIAPDEAPSSMAVPTPVSGPGVTMQTEPVPIVKVALPVPVPAPASTPDTIDPASVGQYRIAIIAAAKRYRQYPRVALENGWEGRTEVRMAIDVNGSIASIGIRSRSGYDILDRQALEMIRKAKPLAPMPATLRGKGFTLDLPVLFSLKEETG